MILWGIVFALTTSVFSFSVSLSDVARTFEGYDTTLVQEAVDVPYVTPDTKITLPSFNEERLEQLSQAYFSRGLQGYVSKSQWQLLFSYQDFLVEEQGADGRLTKLYPQGVKVTFHCTYAGGYFYQNHHLYQIEKGELYGR